MRLSSSKFSPYFLQKYSSFKTQTHPSLFYISISVPSLQHLLWEFSSVRDFHVKNRWWKEILPHIMFLFLKKLFFWILSSMYNHMIKLLKGKHAHHSMLKWFSYTMKSLMQLCTTRHAMMIQKLHLISVKWSLICLKIHNVSKEHFFC